MASTKYITLNLQEKVPEHVLRTEDDFSSDSGSEIEQESENSEDEKMETHHDEESERKIENSGWADAMAKVLKTNTPKGKKTIVLAKAKKMNDVVKDKKPLDIGFEIDCEIKEEKRDINLIKEETEEKKQVERPMSKIKNREWKLKARIKPNILEKNRERTLAKIATKGIVQLFNTVRDHQKKLNKKLNEAGTERRREKVLKSVDKQAFLDMLMGSTGTNAQKKDSTKSEPDIKEEDKTSWHVLRDDFMMGASLKDWDKKQETPNRPTEAKKPDATTSNDDIVNSSEDSDGMMESDNFDVCGRDTSDEG